MHCTRVEFGRVTYWLQTLRSWRRWTHRKSTQNDSMQKRWYFPPKKEEFIFQSQMDESNFLEEIRNWEHPLRYGSDQLNEKVTLIFLENQKGLFHHFTTHFRMPVKRWMVFGPCREALFTAITLNPESSFTRREKNHSVFHWKNIDVFRTTHTNLDVMQEKYIDDHWNIDGSRDLSDSWTGFTQFILLEEKPPDGYMWSWERLTRKQLTSRPDHLWPEFWEKMGKKAKLKEKQKWSHEELHLDNARKLRGIYFIDLEDRESKETIKNARKNLETPLLLRPAKLSRAIRIVGMVRPIKSKQNLRVFWKLVNLQDCVWENHCRLIMKSKLQEKEIIHYSTTIWSQIYSYASSYENSSSKGSSGQGMANIGENFGVELDESQKWK